MMTTTIDLVARLRAIPVWMVGKHGMKPGWQEHGTTAYDAATAIETLTAERDAALARVAVLEEAATRFAQYEGHHLYCGHAPDYIKPCVCGFNAASDKLRKALEASHD